MKGDDLRSSLAIVAIACSACSSIDPERQSYPSAWPQLSPAPVRKCEPPVGTFENIHWNEHYEYPESSGPRTPAPRLSSVLGVSAVEAPVTHLRLQKLSNGDLQIEALSVKEGAEQSLKSRVISSTELQCQDHRWMISTTSTHEGFSGYQQEDFDPLYSAMYYVGTLGLGAPISAWWNFVFTTTSDGSLALRRQNMSSAVLLVMFYSRLAMNDDWFLYRPTDTQSMIERAQREPEFALSTRKSESGSLPLLPSPDACEAESALPSQELFQQGRAFFAHKHYTESLACFTSASEHPDGGNREAMWQLCLMHELGLGVEKNLDVAKRWCQRANS